MSCCCPEGKQGPAAWELGPEIIWSSEQNFVFLLEMKKSAVKWSLRRLWKIRWPLAFQSLAGALLRWML